LRFFDLEKGHTMGSSISSGARSCTGRTVLLVVLGVMAFGVAAPSAGAAKIDVCTLVTADDLGSVYGIVFQPGQASGTSSCSYHTTEGRSINVILGVVSDPSSKAAKQDFKSLTAPQKTQSGSYKFAKLKGVGDAARYLALADLGQGSFLAARLVVREGKVIVTVSPTVTDTDLNTIEDKPSTIAIAKLALDRL
jgi:hypothetical protein